MKIKEVAGQFKYLDIITALFVAILIISNIASSKITSFGSITLDAGVILFPFTYIFGDVLTEVYGYARGRRVIWIGLLCNVLMAAVFMLVTVLPPAADWPNQKAFESVLGMTPRIVLASMIAYFCGEFINSFILAKLKIRTKGKYLWVRTIGSTLFGELFDTLLFITIAFWGIFPMQVIISLLISNYILKVGLEVLFTPFTYLIVNKLKKAEHEDYYDRKTNFNPFVLEVKNADK
jgi:uncharacterized integral membrane protein (TIGR00697 family)